MKDAGGVRRDLADLAPGRPTPLLVRLWWITEVRGIFALALGVAILTTDAGRPALLNFIALYWLVGSLLVLRVALPNRSLPGARLGIAAGVIGVATAVMTLLRRWVGLSGDAITTPLGIAIILMGIMRILGGFEAERRTGRRWTFGGLLLGGVEIVLGIVLLSSIWLGIQAVLIAAVVWAFVGGSLLVLDGLQARRLWNTTYRVARGARRPAQPP